MSNNIVDKNLERVIKIKMYADSLNSVEDIENISIQDINLMGNKLNMDLTEIVKLKKLKSLSLEFFEITDEVIETINKLDYIQKVEFLMCSFNARAKLSKNIKFINVYNCKKFNINILSLISKLEELKLTSSGMVDVESISHFQDLKYLKISACSVGNFSYISLLKNLEKIYLTNIKLPFDINISNMGNLKFISLNGSKVEDKDKYIENLYIQNKELIIEFREDDLPII